MLQATKGIVLRTVKYGDTSLITTVYTELYGIQTYIVKGVRTGSKNAAGKMVFFQPAAMLEMEVYHNDLKQLQFIKEYNWSHLYQQVFFDVVKNSVAIFLVELLQHSLKQPEANPELFHLIEDSLLQLDKGTDTFAANLPLYFILHLGSELGFRIHGNYSVQTPVLDLGEGMFIKEKPLHPYYIDGLYAETTSRVLDINFYNDLENIALNRGTRQELLQAYLNYLTLHIHDFGQIRSLPILQEVLG